MVLRQKRVAIGIFSNHTDVEHTLNELKKAGFPATQISIVAKYADLEAQLINVGMSHSAFDKAQSDTAMIVMLVGSLLGGIVGCLTGLGILAMPGVSFIVAVGNAGTAAFTTLAGAGFGVVSGSLISTIAGFEKVSSSEKMTRDGCGQDEFLVMVEGTDDEVDWAKSILDQSHSNKVWVCLTNEQST